eukprot:scaffold30923_cov73-Phaeocystis_antarctica.AAC.1
MMYLDACTCVAGRGLERLGAAGERARDSRKGDLSVICHMCVQTVEQLKFSLNSVQHTAVLRPQSFQFHCSVEFQNEIPVSRLVDV